MKNETVRKVISVDKINYSPLFTFKQEDDVMLRLSLYKNSLPFDVTGQKIALGAKRQNGSLVQMLDGFTINKNEIDINLKNSVLAVPGKVECDLEIQDAEGKMTTASFFIHVERKMQ